MSGSLMVMFQAFRGFRVAWLTALLALVTASSLANAGARFDPKEIERRITKEATRLQDELVRIRRDLHQHPELSGSEIRTAGIVADRLRSYGLEVRTGIGGHGVVGILAGERAGPVVAYRADMDALPQEIEEQERVDFASATPGVSHACGHDVHTTVGLGVAGVLSTMRESLAGTVVFIFQPAEETVQGARQMIAEGVLEDPAGEAIFAVHVGPLATGSMIALPGIGLPGLEQFTIELRGGENLDRAARELVDSIRDIGTVQYPETNEEWASYFGAMFQRDSILEHFILAMAWEDESAPGEEEEEVTVSGYFKASDPKEYARAMEAMRAMLLDLEAEGVSTTMESETALPDMFCDRELVEWATEPIKSILGSDSVLTAYHSLPFFGEDFAYYLERIPGAMFFLGASNSERGLSAHPHSPTFGVDEEAILVGTKAMSNVLVQYLLRSDE